MKAVVLASCAIAFFTTSALANQPVKEQPVHKDTKQQPAVFITGSLIPKRVPLRRIGTLIISPVRVIDRAEMDQSGRQTTIGILASVP